MGHQWAWLPDVAATIAALLARRRELEPFARFHMQGHWDPDGSEMSQAIQRVVARYGGRAVVKSFPRWLVKMAAPFNATLREMVEMHYLWRLPVRLRNDKLVDFFRRGTAYPARQRGLSDAARPGLSARRRDKLRGVTRRSGSQTGALL